ncbi:unnamed protein product [Durusdinium trenchii]|uniref:Uncharacterized protein n=1 Tax=Durusdinium trenchii TaxID=1381693 RepID=A0ABP0QLI1_9DINO
MKTVVSILLGQQLGFANAYSAEVHADGRIDRLMRVEDNQEEQLATVKSHKSTVDDEVFNDGEKNSLNSFFECAKEGGNCTCEDGVVLYGRPSLGAWQELRVQGSVLCTASLFDSSVAPAGETNICRCYSLSWCRSNNENHFINDLSHRRRNNLGTPGKNLHQRRRWCGWGPRDCTWSMWSKWSECRGGEECTETGVSERTRHKESEAANGGSCKDEPTSDIKQCSWVGCKQAQAQGTEAKQEANSAEERIGAVAQLLSAHSEAVGERFAATAKALATNGELTPLKLAQLAAAQLVNPLPKMELEDLRAQTITVCMEALYGVTGAAAMAEGIANDMGLEAADEGVTIFRVSS